MINPFTANVASVPRTHPREGQGDNFASVPLTPENEITATHWMAFATSWIVAILALIVLSDHFGGQRLSLF